MVQPIELEKLKIFQKPISAVAANVSILKPV